MERENCLKFSAPSPSTPRAESLGLNNVEHVAYRLALHVACRLAVWCSGNTLVSINAVALHRARLVLGWVTAFGAGKLSHYVTSHPGQLSLSAFRGRLQLDVRNLSRGMRHPVNAYEVEAGTV